MQAICRWEKSWQTPRRFSKNVSTGVLTSVALVSNRKSRMNALRQVERGLQQRTPVRKRFARIFRELRSRLAPGRIENEL